MKRLYQDLSVDEPMPDEMLAEREDIIALIDEYVATRKEDFEDLPQSHTTVQ